MRLSAFENASVAIAIFATPDRSDLPLLWTVQKNQIVCGRKGKQHGTDNRRHMSRTWSVCRSTRRKWLLFLLLPCSSPQWLSAQVEDKRFISIGVFASGDCGCCHTVGGMIQTGQEIAPAVSDFSVGSIFHHFCCLLCGQGLQFFPNGFCLHFYAADFQRFLGGLCNPCQNGSDLCNCLAAESLCFFRCHLCLSLFQLFLIACCRIALRLCRKIRKR